jgi:hypothetical protein
LEIREAGLLSWGFFNVTQRAEGLDAELDTMFANRDAELHSLWQRAHDEGITVSKLLENLEQRKLIFRFDDRYRTRFAETVRLLFLLRQRFTDDDWDTAQRLVGDLKLDLRRRRFPRRDIAPDDVLDRLPFVSGLERSAVEALLGDEGEMIRLSRFQADAVVRQITALREENDSAIVISAGTGAGKTKAFYVPALAHVANTLAERRFIQIMALYPRVELLKDQLAETYAEARKLDGLLLDAGKRPITIGAYYGDVPRSAAALLKYGGAENWRWSREHEGWICPYFSCPACKEPMVWRKQDVETEANKEDGRYARLHCMDLACGSEVGSDRLMLTRRQMLEAPPDVLFTTTEMLNRRLSNGEEWPLFGIGVEYPPRLLLMDEIHLSEGFHGAHIAHLLRRWRFGRGMRSGQSLCIVGLSATLTGAQAFFSRLTNIPAHRVSTITPDAEDLIERSLEYNLAIRDNPVAGAALLSTSVRVVQLLARILDPLDRQVSEGAYGQRVFAFSDKLDVVNRWHHIALEVENPAEPYSRLLFVDRNRYTDLEQKARSDYGQNWWMPAQLGHELSEALQIDLTSSQYRGVDSRANLVIATSTLEVGFNDPTVGAIVQHRAPFSRASFLQRKGRAGRQTVMRPWMVLVSSAYGYDRWAFQHAETLFDPLLPPIELPLENVYVRKIQATYALIDWLTYILHSEGCLANVWGLLTNDESHRDGTLAPLRTRLTEILHNILRDPSSLEAHIRQALALDDDFALATILWGEPRSLMLDAIPTLLRQLETSWQVIEKDADALTLIPWADQPSATPTPEFLPSALFSDLNLFEVLVRVPVRETGAAVRSQESLGLVLAMNEFAPGRVNKRFARKDDRFEAHWIPVPSHPDQNVLAIESLDILAEGLGHVTLDGIGVELFRPQVFNLRRTPYAIDPSSYARFRWQSRFDPHSRYENSVGLTLNLVSGALAQFCGPVHVFTQANHAWVDVTRAATAVDVSLRYREGGRIHASYPFTANDKPAGLGFIVTVDGLRFDYRPLDTNGLRNNGAWCTLYRDLAPRYFLHLLQRDPRLCALNLSSREIEWLWQLETSMLVKLAVETHCSLGEAAAIVSQNRLTYAPAALDILFENRGQDDIDERGGSGYLRSKIVELLYQPAIDAALTEHAVVLWDDRHDGLNAWLEGVYASSLGATLFAAILAFVPDVNGDDLHLDVTPDALWVTELTGGGIGLVTRIADAMARFPARFDRVWLHTLRTCHRADLASRLFTVSDLITSGNPHLQQAFAALRERRDLPRLEQTRLELTRVLETQGIPAGRSLSIAINSRFLRPNSSADSDLLIARLARLWREEQARLGCNIDLRVFAVAAASVREMRDEIQRVLERVGELTLTDAQIHNLLQSLLWLTCSDSCPDCVEKAHLFQAGEPPSRMLILALVEEHSPVVRYGNADWMYIVEAALQAGTPARIVCDQESLAACKAALILLLGTPLDVGYQSFYPALDAVERTGRDWQFTLVIRELAEA